MRVDMATQKKLLDELVKAMQVHAFHWIKFDLLLYKEKSQITSEISDEWLQSEYSQKKPHLEELV